MRTAYLVIIALLALTCEAYSASDQEILQSAKGVLAGNVFNDSATASINGDSFNYQ